jgi:hypothetical protein
MKKNAVRHLKWFTSVAVLAVMLATTVMTTLVVSHPVLAATIPVTSNTNWSALTVTSADTVEVRNGATLTVDVTNAVCGALQLGGTSGTGAGTLTFSGTNPSLTVTSLGGFSGNVVLGGTGTTRGGTITFTSGSTLTATGTVTMGSANNQPGTIIMTNGGTLSTAGFALSGTGTKTFTRGTGTVKLTATNTLPSTIFTSFNNLEIVSGTTTMAATITVGGTLNVDSGSTFTIGAFSITVTGATTVSGTILFTSTTGTKTFIGLVTINPGGTWTNSANSAITFRGGITNSGTFTAGTGLHTFNTNSQALTGTFSIPRVTVTGVTLTNTNTLTVATALAGTGTLTQGTGAILNIGGTSAITTLTATAVGNTVNFNGAAQTACKVTIYNNLTLSSTLAKTFATTPTVNGILSMEGTATITVTTGVVTYGTAATLRYNTSTTRTASAEEWITPFAATGGVIIDNTGTITLNSAKVFNSEIPLTINSGSTLSTSGSNYAMTFGGDFINNGGTFTAGSSAITIANTSTTQSIAGFTTTGTVSMTKTAGTATFTGNVNGGALTINGSYPGTLSLGNNLTHTFTGNWTIISTGIIDGGNSLLRIGGNSSSTLGGYFYMGSSTVEYYRGGAQTIAGVDFYNLTLSGSGIKTMQASRAPEVENILSIEGTATVSGAFVYRANATLQYNTSTARTSGAEWITPFTANGGVIIANTGNITLNAPKVINASVSINTGAKLNLSTWTSTANSLTLGSANQVCGTWGHNLSAAVHKDNTYFAPATGILNVLCFKATPTFTGVTASQAISYGTASVTLGGTVSASGPIYPANGENVSVMINSMSQNATISDDTGGFSIIFPTSTIPYSALPYTITYSYAGNANLNAATDTSTALTVNMASQTITFGALPVKNYGDPDFPLGATASSGLTVSYSSSNTSVATIVSGMIHIVNIGTSTITASQAGDSNYSAATPVDQILTVTPIPITIVEFSAPNDISFGDLQIGTNNNSSGILTVNVSPSDQNWYVAINDPESSTQGHMTLWTGAYNTSIKLETAMNISSEFSEVTLPDSSIIIPSRTGYYSGAINFKQEVTWNDEPGSYQIVVTFTLMVP